MSDWNLSVVLIVPSEYRERANRISCFLGHDVLPGRSYSIPLSSDGSEPATHYGLRTAAAQSFIEQVQAVSGKAALDPEELASFDLMEDDVREVVASLILDARDADDMDGHFEAVADANNLTTIQFDS